MNTQYQSYFNQDLPADPTIAAHAAAAMRNSPWSAYGQSHGDVMRSQGDENAALYGLAAGKANYDFSLQRQQAQNQLVLNGLQQMQQQGQDQANLANSRLGMTAGIYNSLLSGLYG